MSTALFVSSDLLFAGRLESAGAPLGIRVIQETGSEAISRVLEEGKICAVVLDLNHRGLRPADVMELLPEENRPLTIAFGPHVNTESLDAARSAGFDHVLPRSRFAGDVPKLLKQAANPT